LQMLSLTPETKVPGVLIFSPRAVGWLDVGIGLAFLKFESAPVARLLLETGAMDSWILASKPTNPSRSKGFEDAKQKAEGVHFLGVQSSPQAESFAGFLKSLIYRRFKYNFSESSI